MIYNFLKILAKLSIPFYFSSVEINGKENIPKECRPIILAPNHQNAFLDAIVIAVAHDKFREYSLKNFQDLAKKNYILFDVKYVLNKKNVDGRL